MRDRTANEVTLQHGSMGTQPLFWTFFRSSSAMYKRRHIAEKNILVHKIGYFLWWKNSSSRAISGNMEPSGWIMHVEMGVQHLSHRMIDVCRAILSGRE